MKKHSNRYKRKIILLLILCMGIGFAVLTTNVYVYMDAVLKKQSWDVYFTNLKVSEGSVTASLPIISEDNTSIEFSASLELPGEYYEFTVDAVNKSSLNVMIDSINLQLDSDLELEPGDLDYLNYQILYLDGTPVNEGDVLYSNRKATYKVRIQYGEDYEGTYFAFSDGNVDVDMTINYVLSNSPQEAAPPANFATMSTFIAKSDESINFSTISSSANGRGLYVMSGTEDDDYPIYYYRGNVSNNNAKFAGFCWKIVRSTETGGTKLIYNGVPNGSGQCTNTTGTASQISTKSTFNSSRNSLAYSGYMYGTVYSANTTSTSSSHLYGNTFTYSGGTYTLSNTSSGADNTHHYTCFNSTGTCSSIYYVYYLAGTTAHYIYIQNGKSVYDAMREMYTNTTSSAVKVALDNWFNNTFRTYFTNNSIDYNDYLEDTVWCNDRSINTIGTGDFLVNSGWNPNGGSLTEYLKYSSYGRLYAGTPSLSCSSKNDSFTVNESEYGNGKLTYPVGMLTADELNIAGGQLYSVANNNTDYYLYTSTDWWGLSPYNFNESDGVGGFGVGSLGDEFSKYVTDSLYLRPAISLRSDVKIFGGDGSRNTPYIFDKD